VSLLNFSARQMAGKVRRREVSSVELVQAHLGQIERIDPTIHAVTLILQDSALHDAEAADRRLASGEACGPLHGVPVSIKDSIDIGGVLTTAGTLGRRNAPPAAEDATLVRRLREAGAIPIAKTNLPDLLFSFESDNLIFGRTNNPHNSECTSGGSSGGEAALIAASGSPLGLGSDSAGSVRLPAHFCGIASIKPTSGRLPRSGHVPPAGGWIERLWQIGPMARSVADLRLAMQVLAGEDGADFTSPPVPLLEPPDLRNLRVAFFDDNGFAACIPPVKDAVRRCAGFLSQTGAAVEQERPPGVERAYELEMAIFGADGAEGIDVYLTEHGSTAIHPLTTDFVNRMRPFRASGAEFAHRWAQWDEYRAQMARFFERYDAVVCPVYTQPALRHGQSRIDSNFEGFSYTMAWNLAGAPAAVVRCAEFEGLPIGVQVVAKPWRDLTALAISEAIEAEFGGWKAPSHNPTLREGQQQPYSTGTNAKPTGELTWMFSPVNVSRPVFWSTR
jgi:amidase